MTPLNQITQQNASGSEELASTAEEMSGQAEQLQELMGFFNTGATAGTARRAQRKVDGEKANKTAENPRREDAEYVRFEEGKRWHH